jgi:hypothetical protein
MATSRDSALSRSKVYLNAPGRCVRPRRRSWPERQQYSPHLRELFRADSALPVPRPQCDAALGHTVTMPRPGAARDERLEWVALAALTAIAIALRVYRLTEWSLSEDEFPTWMDSLEFTWSNPRPLLYALNHYLVLPVLGLRELGLRVIPVAAGIAAVPTVYALLRRLDLRMEGLATAALIALSTWHVYWSQFARYYSLVFLLCALYGLALLGWVRHRRAGWLCLAATSGILAVLAHPTALPVIGVGALIVAWHDQANSRRHGSLWPWAVTLGAALLAAVVRYGPIIASWSTQWRYAHTSLPLALAFLDWMTAPVVICALAGMVLWWRAERGPVPQIVAITALLPTALFLGLSRVMNISVSYLYATTPFYFLAAGWLLARVAQSMTAPGRTPLIPSAVVVTVVAAANLVGLASHFRDGGRVPWRDAAYALPSLTGPRDTILAEQAEGGRQPLHFYVRELPLGALRPDSLTLGRVVHRGGAPWVLVTRVDRAGFGFHEYQFAEVYAWLDAHCQHIKDFTTPRLDFRRNELQLFRCRPDARAAPDSASRTARNE